ncbi:universal stress protein [Natronolimnohabitans sp. A-GB9]|uniref:universal stress protein n=1 Tax=Natronolimnohabitans sp. A-GB9 TaxID=3069757 RepID=UPI0027B2CE1C|nr:universal stress protein [Natronolimnohabitans sp. A-GB9]MDQ2051248.1 universal stress protein [Natronolimnohabitans sp. A-GB9]
MYDRILVPTDGSEPAAAAIEEGIELARQQDAELHALYVVEPIPLGRFSAGPKPASAEWEDVVDEQRSEGEEATADVAERAAEYDLEVVEAIEHGSPHAQILSYVDEADIDAVVMGTHGRSGADRLVLGSVTEKVVRKSEVPVLTVRET